LNATQYQSKNESIHKNEYFLCPQGIWLLAEYMINSADDENKRHRAKEIFLNQTFHGGILLRNPKGIRRIDCDFRIRVRYQAGAFISDRPHRKRCRRVYLDG